MFWWLRHSKQVLVAEVLEGVLVAEVLAVVVVAEALAVVVVAEALEATFSLIILKLQIFEAKHAFPLFL